MENVKDANLVISGDLVKNPIASIDSFPDVLAAVLGNDASDPRMIRENLRQLSNLVGDSFGRLGVVELDEVIDISEILFCLAGPDYSASHSSTI